MANADHDRREGIATIADDKILMLWSPAIFTVGGALFIARRALVLENPLKQRTTLQRRRRAKPVAAYEDDSDHYPSCTSRQDRAWDLRTASSGTKHPRRSPRLGDHF